MGWVDLIIMLRGFEAGEIAELNRFRHVVLAPSWAMGSKMTPNKFLPLPIDGPTEIKETMTKEQFLALGQMLKNIGKA